MLERLPRIHEKTGKPYRFISFQQDKIQQLKDMDLFIVGRLAEIGIASKEKKPFREIWKGVSAGERHKDALRMALTYVHIAGLKDPESVLAELRRWGQLCQPPFENENDLKRIVDASFKYEFPKEEGNLDEIEEKEKLEPISDSIRQRAQDILRKSPSPLLELRNSLDKVIVREVRNKLYCFLVLLSGVRKDPKQKQFIVLRGNPGGGKSNIANILTSAFKTKKVARFSATALDYTDLENYEILYIQE